MNTRHVSAIIPTKNRRNDLLAAVRTLLRQTILPTQIVVVDQSPDDGALRCLEAELAGITGVRLDYVHDPSLSGLTAARNCALSRATGDVWLFLDDDVLLEPEFVEQLLEVYRKYPKAGGVSGIITNYQRPPLPFRLWNALFARGPFHDERQPIHWECERLRNSEPIAVQKLNGGLMSFPASFICDRRFDPNLRAECLAEDVDFCCRLPAGTLLLMAPRARLVHNHSPLGRVRSHWLRAHAQSSYYLYEKNWKYGIKNRLCFAWLNIGYALAVGAFCLTRGSLEGTRAFQAGKLAGKALANPASAPHRRTSSISES